MQKQSQTLRIELSSGSLQYQGPQGDLLQSFWTSLSIIFKLSSWYVGEGKKYQNKQRGCGYYCVRYDGQCMVEKCDKGCNFKKGRIKQQRNILKHGCSFVTISATLQASDRERRIQVFLMIFVVFVCVLSSF